MRSHLQGARLPDFLIVGAMKSGTTSLHHILSDHDNVFIPPFEVSFFSIDDIHQHPDFFLESSRQWSFHDYAEHFQEYLSWYSAFFDDAKEGQLVGERSTSYMDSQEAAPRIAALLPNAKLIFMLRDPVSRTYSHYWHLVRTGRAVYDFEDSIQYMPGPLLQRSLYKRQILRYRTHFPDANMRFLIFEAFRQDIQSVVDEVCEWLGLKSSVDTKALETRTNPATTPRSLRLHILHNRLFRRLAAERYLDSHLPNMPSNKSNVVARTISYVFRKINLRTRRAYPPMKPRTERFLQRLLAKENRGLSELIGKDVREYWPYMED